MGLKTSRSVTAHSLLTLGLLTTNTTLLAQAQVDGPSSDDGKTPYTESFTTGDVVPAPLPVDEDVSDANRPLVNPEDLEDDGDSRSDTFMFGFTGALEVPHIINVGFETLTYRKFGMSLNYGNISRNVSGVDVGMKHSDIRLRYHPWAGSFFGGVAVGQHTLTGEKSKDISLTYSGTTTVVPTTVKVSASSNYVAPHIGWFSVWESGFTMGLDLGWMVPTGAKSSVEATFSNLPAGAETELRNTPEFTKAKKEVEDAADSYIKKSLPFISMIRIGWMF